MKIKFRINFKDFEEFKGKYSFALEYKVSGTTTVVFGSVILPSKEKVSVAGCAILSPEDTFVASIGVKTAFRNILKYVFTPTQYPVKLRSALYSAFRQYLAEFEWCEDEVTFD